MRERFLVLDGLRGVAALAVFWSHLSVGPNWPAVNPATAVDFFFLLSGFVLAHAYEPRLGKPGALRDFIRDRIIRIHPLLVLSLVPSALRMALTPDPHRDPLLLLTFPAAAIPFPALWLSPFPKIIFPHNPPSWSLFWELLASLLFALVAPRLSTRNLALVTVMLIAASWVTISSGANLSPDSLTAAARTIPCFTLGVLLHRLHRSGKLTFPAWTGAAAAPALIATLLMPSLLPGWILFPLFSFMIHPLIIACAAARTARFAPLCAFLGGISYPLYVLHFPILRALVAMFGPPIGAMAVIQPLLCLLLVWVAWRLYDEPLRGWLRRRFGSRGHKQPGSSPEGS